MTAFRKLVRHMAVRYISACIAAGGLIIACAIAVFPDAPSPDHLDVPYEPTNPRVVDAMLKLAGAGPKDIHYDLGCGDGRIVIMAARKYKVKHAFGIDLDPQRLREAEERAEAHDLSDKTTFIQKNIFESDISRATVVTAYLLNHINLKMRPLLYAQLQPGTRVVTHAFHMADWQPDKIVKHPSARDNTINLWVIPAPLGGDWEWSTDTKAGAVQSGMKLSQIFQIVTGTVTFGTAQKSAIRDPRVYGTDVSFSAAGAVVGGRVVSIKYQGTARGDSIKGTQVWEGGNLSGTYPWNAKRKGISVLGRWTIEVPQKSMYNGVLSVRKEGVTKLYASFYPKSANSEFRIHDVYILGTSLYFRLPLSYTEYVLFTGDLGADKGSGTAAGKKMSTDYHEEGKDAVTWTTPWTAVKL